MNEDPRGLIPVDDEAVRYIRTGDYHNALATLEHALGEGVAWWPMFEREPAALIEHLRRLIGTFVQVHARPLASENAHLRTENEALRTAIGTELNGLVHRLATGGVL